MKGLKRNAITTAIMFFGLALSIDAYCRQSPADSYYNDNIASQAPSQVSPSEAYYNNNMRSGDEWDEDGGPGGSGEGSNTGVGVPVGEAGLSVLTGIAAYGLFVYTKRRKRSITTSDKKQNNQ